MILFDHQAEAAMQARRDLIAEYFTARKTIIDSESGVPYRPVPPDLMYVDADGLAAGLMGRAVCDLSPFETGQLDAGGTLSREYGDIRIDPKANVYEAIAADIATFQGANKRIVVAALSTGSAERLKGLLVEHGAPAIKNSEIDDARPGKTVIGVVELDRGFHLGDLVVITESDMLGERMARPGRRRIRPENFIAEVSSLSPGDLVVHVDHGIGQFEDLETIEVVLRTSAGTTTPGNLQRNPETNGPRLAFTFDPQGTDVSEFRVQLRANDTALSEIWLYRWTLNA